jgi:hypothetical protein
VEEAPAEADDEARAISAKHLMGLDGCCYRHAQLLDRSVGHLTARRVG